MQLRLLFAVLVSYLALSFYSHSASDDNSLEKIILGAATNKPPYVMQKTQSGFEIELLRKTFELMGRSVEFRYIDFRPGAKVIDIFELDAVSGANKNIFSDVGALSDVYIEYHNVAISLAENQFKIEKILDLSKYSIISFPLADKALGDDFGIVKKLSPKFITMLDHTKQPELLVRKRIDVLVMDQYIFEYYLKQTEWANDIDKMQIHRVFPVNRFKVAFKDKSNIAQFNAALKQFLALKDYQQLKEKYNFH